MNSETTINQTLKAEMAASGTTRKQLSTYLKLSRSNLYQRLSGNRAWTVEELEDVSNYLGMSIWDLFREAELRQKQESEEDK